MPYYSVKIKATMPIVYNLQAKSKTEAWEKVKKIATEAGTLIHLISVREIRD